MFEGLLNETSLEVTVTRKSKLTGSGDPVDDRGGKTDLWVVKISQFVVEARFIDEGVWLDHHLTEVLVNTSELTTNRELRMINRPGLNKRGEYYVYRIAGNFAEVFNLAIWCIR